MATLDPAAVRDATFHIKHDTEPSATLVAGFASFGLAGLTAVDFLVDQLELIETGHIVAERLPAFTPFEDGVPRHHSRLFSRDDLDLTVLVNDLFIPTWAADSFAQAVLHWTDRHDVEEITVLAGVPYPHLDHSVSYVATEDYRTVRLAESRLPPMQSGFLEGVNAGLMGRGMDSPLRTALLVTPVHAQVPDVEAAIRLVEAFETVYGLDVDAEPLEAFAAEVNQYYSDLAARLEAVEDVDRSEDRMYM